MSAEQLAITVIGAGSVGTSLAIRFVDLGHRVTFGARDLDSPKLTAARAAVPDAQAVPIDRAAAGADLIVLAVPYDGLVTALQALGDVGGGVLVDATNAVRQTLPDGCDSVLDVIRRSLPQATVVKAFNTVGAEVMRAPSVDGRAAFLPIAGPSPAAERVRDLAATMGFETLVIGDESTARLLEDHARLWIHLAMRVGVGRGFAFGLLREQGDDHG